MNEKDFTVNHSVIVNKRWLFQIYLPHLKNETYELRLTAAETRQRAYALMEQTKKLLSDIQRSEPS